MGAIFPSIDVELVRCLKRALPLAMFVESGTFQGDTAELCAPSFERVYTIEVSADLHARAARRLGHRGNVVCLAGDSASVLRELKSSLADRSVLYWLDAHGRGQETAGRANECPLLSELDAIAPLNERSVVLIDDARMFLAPPPTPHEASRWPLLDEVVERLHKVAGRHRLWVINDVIIYAPPAAFTAIVEYGRSRGLDLNALAREAARGRQAAAFGAGTRGVGTQGASAGPVPGRGRSLAIGLNAELSRVPRSERLFAHHLSDLGISRLLDIGANTGQFAQKLRDLGYAGTIFSVEPQATAYGRLVAQTRRDPRWIALARQGAGAASATLELNIAENGWSSSLRPVHANHLRAEPRTRTVAHERVFINRSADLLSPHVLDAIEALKIDVQGYEDQVLEGYAPYLAKVRLLLLELSLVECYRGSPDLFDLDGLLVNRYGFSRVSLEPSYYDEHGGTVQQYDGIYFRPASGAAPPIANASSGVRVSAVLTSIGGALTRLRPDGLDVGPHWLGVCMTSWRKICGRVISVSEAGPPEGIEWARTAARPTIAELLHAAPLEPGQHLLLTNADIAYTEEFVQLLPTLDPLGAYYGHRLDIEEEESSPGTVRSRGVFPYGFDYFLLPHALLDALKSERAIPLEFRIGEPWWDYALPLLALALGFPVKRLITAGPLALHFYHPSRYSREVWLANGARFIEFARQLLERTPNSATGSLTDLVSGEGDLESRLNRISERIIQTLP